MKWSEFFGKRFMESEVPADLSNVQQDASTQPPSSTNSQSVSQEQNTGNPTTVQENKSLDGGIQNQISEAQKQFDALNAKIKELEEANRKLVMRGSLQEQPHQKTDEEIIMDLCVNRRRYGNETDNTERTNSSAS